MANHTPEPIRVAIVLDIADHNHDLLLIWAATRAAKLIQDLWRHGIRAEIVSIDINGDTRFNW